MNRDVTALIRDLRAQGFEVALGRSGHYRVSRGGRFVTTIPCSPSDWRALKNNVTRLRRHGYRPPTRHNKPKRRAA